LASTAKADTYKSIDQGVTWTLVNSANSMGARFAAGAALRQVGSVTSLVVCGGKSSSNAVLADCWSSSSSAAAVGAVWTRTIAAAAFGQKSHHSMLAIGQSLLLFAGLDASSNQKNDVWRSDNGAVSWNLLGNAGFTPRHYHAAAVHRTYQAQANDAQQNNAAATSIIMVAGGWSQSGSSALNDVWISNDGGTSFVSATASAPWAARQGHQLVGAGGAWYLFGGQIGALTTMANQDGQFRSHCCKFALAPSCEKRERALTRASLLVLCSLDQRRWRIVGSAVLLHSVLRLQNGFLRRVNIDVIPVRWNDPCCWRKQHRCIVLLQ
jgi:hypothetical protein